MDGPADNGGMARALATLAVALAAGAASFFFAFMIAYEIMAGDDYCDGVCLNALGGAFLVAVSVGALTAVVLGFIAWRHLRSRPARRT